MMNIEEVATLIGKGLWELGICNEPAQVFYPIAEKIMEGCRGNMAATQMQVEHRIQRDHVQIGDVQLNQSQSAQVIQHLHNVEQAKKLRH